ncbi:hypothetical protein KZO85_00360 [Chromohalobacter canadensis]|uniref:hypothetical protein n=1 Tax=Chromohalobacter canadensis TaxID=141389 RepID=UPI0021C04D1E|nr:hypothetical protein [Chromohalobacter canadensis]MCT8467029.1 hypothetical protein [Chromohalobacter canadensis]MCT8471223.1 hypothetical protein [Chromohalobacter canadensis]MCT8497526.1 hypothetical protein [Chromohalobacter canadensis]
MKKVLAALLTTLITGCAYNPAPPTAGSDESIVDTAKHFYESSEAGWISISRMQADIQEDEHARFFREGYCLRDDFDPSDFTEIATKKCQQDDGVMTGSWCANPDTGQPIFFARAGSPKATGTEAGCNGYVRKTGILAMEPRFEDDPQWRELAEIWGYKTPSEAAEEEKFVAEKEERLKQEARETYARARQEERLRSQREAEIMLNNIGTSICQINSDTHVRYRGQVDNMRDDMIRVHILQATSFRTNSPIRGFEPLYIWADPHTWELC